MTKLASVLIFLSTLTGAAYGSWCSISLPHFRSEAEEIGYLNSEIDRLVSIRRSKIVSRTMNYCKLTGASPGCPMFIGLFCDPREMEPYEYDGAGHKKLLKGTYGRQHTIVGLHEQLEFIKHEMKSDGTLPAFVPTFGLH